MESEQILKDQLANSSPQIKEFIKSEKWNSTVDKVSQRSSFTEEQKTTLSNEVLFVLLEMESIDDFKQNIERELGIDPSLASYISAEINESVFQPMKEFLSPGIERKDSKQNFPEVAPEIHPMVEEGETAHNVPLPAERGDESVHEPAHTAPAPTNLPTKELAPSAIPMPEQKTEVAPAPELKKEEVAPSPPKPSYPGGQDPYREPIE